MDDKNYIDNPDPLRLKKWFKKPYSVTVTTILIFILVLYPTWAYVANWFENVSANGLASGDVSFIKALSFIIMLLATNITHMILSKHLSLSKTVKEQEYKIDLSERKFQTFIENVPNVAVQGFNPHYKVQYWNSASEKMYGYQKEEAIGKDMTELVIPAKNRKDFIDIIDTTQKDGNSAKSWETLFLSKNRDEIPVFSSYSAVQVSENNFEIFSMEIDLTERKRMEKDLIDAKKKAEASNDAKSNFLANMSHELRTPLNSIIGFSDLLSSNHVGPLNEKQIKYAQNISTSGNHLLGIINDILDISKAEADKLELLYENIQIPRMLQEIVEIMKTTAAEREITIHTDIDPNVGTIEADSGKLKQIIYNLTGNAIKFCDENGNVTIRIKRRENSITFEIEDDGIGIKEENLDKLFKPFSQLDETTKKEYAGTGLGLSLVKKLVELHSGNVWVKSQYGKYSIFGFNLPLSPDDKNLQ
ncbi:PAS domain-containing sensor histidine kinase [Methanohalophilus sp.]